MMTYPSHSLGNAFIRKLTGSIVLLSGVTLLSHAQPAQAELLPVLANQCTARSNGNYICTFKPLKDKNDKLGPSPFRSYEGPVRKVPGGWLPSGYGVLVYEDDQRYEGTFVNGLKQGRGMFLFPDNGRYEGSFDLGEPNGTGTFTFANGDRYNGGIKRGVPHGRGNFAFANSGTYDGEFFLGQVKGQGTYTTKNMRCQGQFFSSKLSGRGSCTFSAGTGYRSYVGEWRGGRPEGRGEVVYSDGTTFSGQFREGKPFVPGKDAK
jgi:hypothetical protein